MTKRMLIDAAHAEETRVAIVEDGRISDFDFITTSKAQLKGNIYLAKITRVEPSLQAAFVEYGGGKQGFLPFAEIHPDYYQLPQDDKRKLLEEQIAEAEAEEAAEDEAFEREQAAREARGGRYRDNDDQNDEAAEGEFASEPGFDEKLTDADIAPPVSSFEPVTEPAELAATTAIPVQEIAPLEMPQTFAPETGDDLSQPLNAQDYAVSSEPVESATEEAAHDGVPGGTDLAEGAEGAAPQAAQGDEQDESSRGGRRNQSGRPAFHRRYRIQEVLKRNQIVLVQVIKEERGNKGCSLTTYISLAGRSAVLMPNSPKGGGISRKITDRETRRRLKEVASEMRTHKGMSVIIRTAGLDRTKAEIRRDYDYLVKLWNQVRETTLGAVAPALIYEEGNLVKRALRDLYTSDIEEIIIEGDASYEDAKEFMRMLMPSQVGKVKQYKEGMPLFAFAGVEEQLSAMMEPQVKLPSGGYIVIHATEALIAIDVNSGRSTTERNVEETAAKTNLEAASEVARQLRLRDLAGLIVVDFIDMNYGKNRKQVERAMKDALKQDRAKIQMGRISTFGLMELSRQRMRPSLSEAMGEICPHCRGTGYIHSVETTGIQVIRTLEKEAATGDYAVLRVTVHPEAALHLLNEKRAMLQSLEQRYNVSVVILMDSAMITGHFRLVKVTKDGREILHEDSKQPRRTNRKRGRRGGRGGRDEQTYSDVAIPAEGEEMPEGGFAEEGDDEDNEPIGGRGQREGGSEPRERSGNRERGERGERGGRNRGGRNRGGRNRNRPRGEGRGDAPREPRPEGEAVQAAPQEPQLDENGLPIPQTEGQQRPERERGERGGRRRGRRGGRGRNRSEGREPRPQGENQQAGEAQQQTSDAPRESNVIEPVWREHSQPSSVNADTPRASFVVPLSEKQTNPAAIASPIRTEAAPEGDKPKRKGWWSKMTE